MFSDGDGSDGVLKGGTGIRGREPSTRSTRDIDLYRRGFTLTQALDDLIRRAAIDLRDHFRFAYVGHTDSIGNDTQPYTDGYRVTFSVHIGLNSKESLQLDLAVGAGITGEVTTTKSATALDLPRLVSHTYRLYPVVDHDYRQGLRDDGRVPRTSIQSRDGPRRPRRSRSHSGHRRCRCCIAQSPPNGVEGRCPRSTSSPPPSWGVGYAKLSRPVPYCAGYHTTELATELVTSLIDPALSGQVNGKTWTHTSLQWT